MITLERSLPWARTRGPRDEVRWRSYTGVDQKSISWKFGCRNVAPKTILKIKNHSCVIDATNQKDQEACHYMLLVHGVLFLIQLPNIQIAAYN